jgi:ribosomal protein L2
VERVEYDPNRSAHIALVLTLMVSAVTSSPQRHSCRR